MGADLQDGRAVYAASKGAITLLTKTIAAEYSSGGDRANALAPEMVGTDILEGIVVHSRAASVAYGDKRALGRVTQPAAGV